VPSATLLLPRGAPRRNRYISLTNYDSLEELRAPLRISIPDRKAHATIEPQGRAFGTAGPFSWQVCEASDTHSAGSRPSMAALTSQARNANETVIGTAGFVGYFYINNGDDSGFVCDLVPDLFNGLLGNHK
jgi:hypothetical protein